MYDIFTYVWLDYFMLNVGVGIDIPYMDPMGYKFLSKPSSKE